ncbi:hypothetical protein BRADI_2g34367v3 [Brachypodium distachyon]|uniref:Uncharacterized protein n=1 Tax=Brachypodium distachyon TaxID=15368 RepID=A0A2K2DBQ7_BRADI|nr:hypothetical protein BRADI_2g34367v3 [Brachypodium distachyon]
MARLGSIIYTMVVGSSSQPHSLCRRRRPPRIQPPPAWFPVAADSRVHTVRSPHAPSPGPGATNLIQRLTSSAWSPPAPAHVDLLQKIRPPVLEKFVFEIRAREGRTKPIDPILKNLNFAEEFDLQLNQSALLGV